MLWAIINTFLDSIADIFYKKALSISSIKPMVFQFAAELLSLPVVVILSFIFDFHF